MSFYSQAELLGLNFASIGQNVLISKKCSLYGAPRIHIGSNVRIDDFCILSAGEGGIEIGSYVHIAAYCSLMGKGKISMKDFSGLSSRVSVYSSNDDYSGENLTNPTVDSVYTGVTSAPVNFERHVIVGAGSIVLPGVTLGEGCAVGSQSLVNKSLVEWNIYMGSPAKRFKSRSKVLLEKEAEFLKSRGLTS